MVELTLYYFQTKLKHNPQKHKWKLQNNWLNKIKNNSGQFLKFNIVFIGDDANLSGRKDTVI